MSSLSKRFACLSPNLVKSACKVIYFFWTVKLKKYILKLKKGSKRNLVTTRLKEAWRPSQLIIKLFQLTNIYITLITCKPILNVISTIFTQKLHNKFHFSFDTTNHNE